MHGLLQNIYSLDVKDDIEKSVLIGEILRNIKDAGYGVVEVNDRKPWGAYVRIDSAHADRFVEEFFAGLTPKEARLGMEDAELSPKILVVSPNQRLSWQYHDRRAERWVFLSDGVYNKSLNDEQGEAVFARIGHAVQFDRGERHRLIGTDGAYTIVAEIWQHVDGGNLSDENDIVRLDDDYSR
jgi:mannose-6-phosphate isomerase